MQAQPCMLTCSPRKLVTALLLIEISCNRGRRLNLNALNAKIPAAVPMTHCCMLPLGTSYPVDRVHVRGGSV